MVYLGRIVLTFESSKWHFFSLPNHLRSIFLSTITFINLCDCKRRKIFAKLKSLDRRSCYFQSRSHLPLSFGPFQTKFSGTPTRYMEHRNDADSNSVGNKHFITFQNVLIYLETEWKQPVCVMFKPDDRDRQNCLFRTDFLDISPNCGGVTPPHLSNVRPCLCDKR